VSATAPGSPEIRDYLLRRMTDSSRAKFEEAYFKDDRLLDRIESEEDLLVADYVLGRLPDAERQLFEQSLLDTPYYRDRVETTRGIKLQLAEERFFRKKAAAAAGPQASRASDSRLFPGGTGIAVGFGLLALLAIASLASAWFLKSALSRTRRELAQRAPHADAAAEAGVVPLARTVVLTPSQGAGPSLVRVNRPAGGALLLVLPRASLAPQAVAFGVTLASGGPVAWDSGELPAKTADDGDLSLRLPPGVPPAGAYAVRLRSRAPAGAPQDSFLGTLDIVER
jgi:hypothetical protein